ncbi:GNAT family N-acetyltransferase [Polaribacter aestuariivivens]|uniref:GNAT family N-acetyltransferase n=1 Tax=Polaribacter aestuariivivens TaxID=2304626 RepID=A0A5S3N073_9FLAO|nr:GNAT family N-acetyltransferase [Polaribacter aestuariivivens]TMM28631.1 GNAT family N-acetyltransferase [Polaribacter aestuariivivens]
MTSEDFIIREIQPADNKELAVVVRTVILEMGAPKVGTAYEDNATDQLFETYQKEKAIYFVVEHKNKIVGGAGIAQLDNFEGNTCELQKMYFLPIARGRGLGTKLITKCLQKAKEFGYDNCYLETLPYMKAAVKLYKKNGFVSLEKPLGNTCHYSCDVWMLKKI